MSSSMALLAEALLKCLLRGTELQILLEKDKHFDKSICINKELNSVIQEINLHMRLDILKIKDLWIVLED